MNSQQREVAESHIFYGRKDKKQNSIITAMLEAKRENPYISKESLLYLALGYKQAQRG